MYRDGKKTPQIIESISLIMEQETAGDPVSGCKWTRKTTDKIARQLSRTGIKVSPKTVGRLLKEMHFSLRVNLKTLESGISKPPDPKVRDRQFRYINKQWRDFVTRGMPVISADTKSRELIGRFHKAGRKWSREPVAVFDHDFPSDSEGVGIPYGVYDIIRNEGFVSVGKSYDTPQFAVDSIRNWWMKVGRIHYTDAEQILILVDAGGSNGYRSRLWKYQLQTAFCNCFGIAVTVCHYPPGSSKWNPVEHRMFSFISGNWAGEPLSSYETMLKFIRTTKTTRGLRIRATLVEKQYQKGIKVLDSQMAEISLKRSRVNPNWNYSIAPN